MLRLRNKVIGFTLAEVLITLSVIGVVAGLTIPTVIQSYNKSVWIKSLNQAYANAITLCTNALAADSTEHITGTTLYKALRNNNMSTARTEIEKYFQNVTIDTNINCGNAQMNSSVCRIPNGGSNRIGVAFPAYYMAISAAPNGVLEFAVDVNGYTKAPNAYTSDLYKFRLDNQGSVITNYRKYINSCDKNPNAQNDYTPEACFIKDMDTIDVDSSS